MICSGVYPFLAIYPPYYKIITVIVLGGQVNVLKACGGIVDFSLSSPVSPISFSLDGYQVIVMPMITDKANEWQKVQAKATEQAKPTEAEVAKPVQPKAKKAKQPVTAK
jgi:hypothetical protein